jgi:hypothetical protein
MTERTIERLHKKEAKDLSEFEPLNVRLEVKSIGIEVLIHTLDPCDAMILSGEVAKALRYIMKTEPKALVLP